MNEIERAAVSAFGLDPDKVRSVALTASAAGLSLQVVIPIDADDYLAIADRMRALREPAAPTLSEVMTNPEKYRDEHNEVRAMAGLPPLPPLEAVWKDPITGDLAFKDDTGAWHEGVSPRAFEQQQTIAQAYIDGKIMPNPVSMPPPSDRVLVDGKWVSAPPRSA